MNLTKFLPGYNWNGVETPLTFGDIEDISAMRWRESEATNLWFWYGPLTGYLPRTGGYALTVRTMSNYSNGDLEATIGILEDTRLIDI